MILNYRRRKQFIIAFVFFSVLFVLGYIIFSNININKDIIMGASCTDGIKNGDEEGVDCGGMLCTPCDIKYLKPLSVLDSGFIKGNEYYDAYAYIQNPNSQYGVPKFKYKFKFYDKSKQFIDEVVGEGYILAGEKKYIIETNIKLEEDPEFVTFTFMDDNFKWQKQKRVNIKLPIFSKTFEDVRYLQIPAKYQASGTLENQSQYSFLNVDVYVFLLDENNEIISLNKTLVNNLRSQEKRRVVVSWFEDVNVDKLKKLEFKAYTNVFDDANILR